MVMLVTDSLFHETHGCIAHVFAHVVTFHVVMLLHLNHERERIINEQFFFFYLCMLKTHENKIKNRKKKNQQIYMHMNKYYFTIRLVFWS